MTNLQVFHKYLWTSLCAFLGGCMAGFFMTLSLVLMENNNPQLTIDQCAEFVVIVSGVLGVLTAIIPLLIAGWYGILNLIERPSNKRF